MMSLMKRFQLRSKDSAVRKAAIKEIAANRDKKSIPALTKILEKGTLPPEEIDCIVNALNEIGSDEAVDILAMKLEKESNPWRAIIALEKIGNKKAVAPLIKFLDSEGKHIDAKTSVVKALGRFKDPTAIEALGRVKRKGGFLIDDEALIALGLVGDTTVAGDIIKRMISPGKYTSLADLEKAWSNVVDYSFCEPIIDLFGIGSSHFNSFESAESLTNALGKILEKYPQKIKEKSLEKMSNLSVEVSYPDGFGRSNTSTIDTRQVNQLARRELTRRSLEKLISTILSKEEINDDTWLIQALELLKSIDPEERGKGISLLGEHKDPRSVKVLVTCLKNHHYNPGTLINALTKMGSLSLEPLLEYIRDTIPFYYKKQHLFLYEEERKQTISYLENAIDALVKIGDNRAVEPLVELLMKETVPIGKKCAQALEQLKWNPPDKSMAALLVVKKEKWQEAASIGPSAFKHLNTAFTSADPETKIEILGAVVNIPGPEVTKMLFQACKNEINDVRQHALKQLRHLNPNQDSIPILLNYLTDEDADIRMAAAIKLENMGWKPNDKQSLALWAAAGRKWDVLLDAGESAIKPLADLMRKERKVKIRNIAIDILLKIGGPAVVEPLIEVLKDEDGGIRKNAVRALTEFGDNRCIEPLTALLEDKNAEVRNLAAKALKKLKQG